MPYSAIGEVVRFGPPCGIWTRYGPSVIGKYTKGIGQIEARLPADDEDPISFALTSLHRLMDQVCWLHVK